MGTDITGTLAGRGSTTGARNCNRCGRVHEPADCPYKTVECHARKKKGHLKKMCSSRAEHFIEEQGSGEQGEQPEEDYVGNFGLFHHSSGGGKPRSVTLVINSIELEMGIDTESARTIVSRDTCDRLLGGQKLTPTTMVLRTYAGETLSLLGTCQVEVIYGDSKHQLELLVANVSGQSPILGREWLAQIRLDWKAVFPTNPLEMEDVLGKHGVFQGGLTP